ncbi:MAG: pantetheine-phosphate adenylyltransferase [Pseudomonadota bacterium]|nr:pantetheine-phosphate adenylyltransferase [Pseudomonadota bacterium]
MKLKELVGVYPGTFDPITNGHLDIISRAIKVVDRLIIGVAENAGKHPLFSHAQRIEMCKGEINSLIKPVIPVEVVSFNNLLMDFVNQVDAHVIIRGLRALSDFEYEFQMAGMNARLNSEIETLFLMASENNQFISSRLVKEVARFEGDISQFVPEKIAKNIANQLKKNKS